MHDILANNNGPVLNNRPNKLLLTYDEAADALSLSRTMISKLVRTGRLEVVHIGRAVRVPRHALLRLCGAGDQAEVKQ